MSGEFLETNPEEYDPSRAFLECMPKMVRMARRAAQNEAISYRGVKVGAAIMFFDKDTFSEALLAGSNIKARPEDEKYCAEMDVIDQANNLGHKNATGLVIAGPSKPLVIGSINDTVTTTLHPCDKCQEKMLDNPHIINDDTLIVTASTEENLYQVHYAQELSMLYQAVETRELMFLESGVNLDFLNWGHRLELYENLKEKNPKASTQLLAKIALENTVEVPND